MDELRRGLWCWSARHPEWEPGEDWDADVRCFAYRGDGGLVVIDPLAPDGDWAAIDELSRSEGVAAVAVTVPWHERDAGEAARRYDAPLFAPALGRERGSLAAASPIRDGDTLPGGAAALRVEPAAEALYWLPRAGTLVAGDALLERGGQLSLCPVSWLEREEDISSVRAGLRRALEWPLQAVAVSHGDQALFEGREGLEQALRA